MRHSETHLVNNLWMNKVSASYGKANLSFYGPFLSSFFVFWLTILMKMPIILAF